MAYVLTDCERCGYPFEWWPTNTVQSPPPECPTCVKLGDRSLLWFMQAIRAAQTPEERHVIRQRFDAAKGRSWTTRERELGG